VIKHEKAEPEQSEQVKRGKHPLSKAATLTKTALDVM
jgi:hypothetical protein